MHVPVQEALAAEQDAEQGGENGEADLIAADDDVAIIDDLGTAAGAQRCSM